MLIEIEGIDGVGKTLQCKLLKRQFEGRGESAIIVRDLDGTVTGKMIREIISRDDIGAEVELWGFARAKAHLVREVIAPALAMGTHVICDRGTGSFLSYFEARGMNPKILRTILWETLTSGYQPITVLIDLTVAQALARNLTKPSFGSKFDKLGNSFFDMQRSIYLRLAEEMKWIVVSGEGTIEEVAHNIFGQLNARV